MLSFALNSEGLIYQFEKVACNLDLPSGADTIQEGQTLELEGFLRETAQESNSLWGSLPEGGGGPVGLEQQTSILEGEGLWPQETTEGRIQPSRHKTDVISAEFETKKKQKTPG